MSPIHQIYCTIFSRLDELEFEFKDITLYIWDILVAGGEEQSKTRVKFVRKKDQIKYMRHKADAFYLRRWRVNPVARKKSTFWEKKNVDMGVLAFWTDNICLKYHRKRSKKQKCTMFFAPGRDLKQN